MWFSISYKKASSKKKCANEEKALRLFLRFGRFFDCIFERKEVSMARNSGTYEIEFCAPSRTYSYSYLSKKKLCFL